MIDLIRIAKNNLKCQTGMIDFVRSREGNSYGKKNNKKKVKFEASLPFYMCV